MKRYIAQFVPWSGGLYAVLDTAEDCLVSEPKPHHEAKAQADTLNTGRADFTGISEWLGGLTINA